MYPYGLIGNCQASALVSESGAIDWLCLPRPDSPPVFGRLLDADGGHFSIEGVGKYSGKQCYLPNTTILITTLTCEDGSAFKITDFCPRFSQHGRMYRPIALFRIVEPLSGSPTIKVSCNPVNGWEKEAVKPERGNSHLRFDFRDEFMRLVTNMPLTYLCEETPFVLKEPLYFGLTWSFGIEDDLVTVTNRFLAETINYWNLWVKHCSIPSLYQKETIRSALTLKLHCYEDTGAILAGLTTSLPEDEGLGRNWDYRFCWLRDAYFALTAFHNLGHFEEMEGFIKFLLNIAEKHEHSREKLRPVYKLDQSLPTPEIEHLNWQGYHGSKPVRSNNQAAEHVQNDVYGEMILTLSPIFFDERFHHLRTKDHEALLGHLAKLCIQNISKPDAGLWELRNGWQEHSFSNLMCWAGIDRIQKIQERGHLKNLESKIAEAKKIAEDAIRSAIKEGSLRNGPKDDTSDAALLQISNLRFPDIDLCRNTVQKIHQELKTGADGATASFLYRYLRNDDFGQPKSAFLICSFWLVQALVKIGQTDNARKVMKDAMSAGNTLGLFSEHFIPTKQQQAGNFPQAYSHVGQINAAFSISPPWDEVL
ncbi:MAG: glucoamylase [Oligoflexia bacterium]|nr:MAG: glucoamylase [Oligoflexia bacterium]